MQRRLWNDTWFSHILKFTYFLIILNEVLKGLRFSINLHSIVNFLAKKKKKCIKHEFLTYLKVHPYTVSYLILVVCAPFRYLHPQNGVQFPASNYIVINQLSLLTYDNTSHLYNDFTLAKLHNRRSPFYFYSMSFVLAFLAIILNIFYIK